MAGACRFGPYCGPGEHYRLGLRLNPTRIFRWWIERLSRNARHDRGRMFARIPEGTLPAILRDHVSAIQNRSESVEKNQATQKLSISSFEIVPFV
jgi:hypothetical protein